MQTRVNTGTQQLFKCQFSNFRRSKRVVLPKIMFKMQGLEYFGFFIVLELVTPYSIILYKILVPVTVILKSKIPVRVRFWFQIS